MTMIPNGAEPIQQMEDSYATYFNELPFPVAIYAGTQLKVHAVNPAFLKLFNKQPGILGATFSNLFPELADQKIYRLLVEAYSSVELKTVQEEAVYINVDGFQKEYFFNISFKPLVNTEGNVWGIMHTIQDITDQVITRKKQELAEALSKNEQLKLITLVENSDDLIGVQDLNGVVTYMNKAGMRLMGAETLEECYRPSIEYFSDRELARITPLLEEPMRTAGKWSGEINYRHFKTGEEIPCHINVFMLHDPNTGEPNGLASVTRDLRKEKAAQKEQQKLLTLV